jgi:hypothetical protein
MDFVRRGYDPQGLTTIYCRKCGRAICRVALSSAGFRSVTRCAICDGAPAEAVKPKYVQQLPGQMPYPIPDPDADLFSFYEDEQLAMREARDKRKPWPGLLKPFFRAFGFNEELAEEKAAKDKLEELPSKKVSKRKIGRDGGGGIWAPDDGPTEE